MDFQDSGYCTDCPYYFRFVRRKYTIPVGRAHIFTFICSTIDATDDTNKVVTRLSRISRALILLQNRTLNGIFATMTILSGRIYALWRIIRHLFYSIYIVIIIDYYQILISTAYLLRYFELTTFGLMNKFENEKGKEANKCQEETEQVLWVRGRAGVWDEARAGAAWAVP